MKEVVETDSKADGATSEKPKEPAGRTVDLKAESIRSAVETLSLVIGPTTLLTALLF
jgi:hypothetical protein